MPNPGFFDAEDSTDATTRAASGETLATSEPTSDATTESATTGTTAPLTSDPSTTEPATSDPTTVDTDCVDRSCETETGPDVCDGPGCSASPLWSRAYAAESIVISGVDVDGAGNVVFGGGYTGSINFGGDTFVNDGNIDRIFLVSLSPDGAHRWSHSYGEGEFQRLFDLAVAPSGRIYVTGGFNETINFGEPNPDIFDPSDQADAFVAAFDEQATLQWAHVIFGPSNQYGKAIALDGETVTVCGTYEGALGLPGIHTPTPNANVFAVRYLAASGVFVVARSWGGVEDDQDVSDLVTLPGGDMALAGRFAGSIYFTPNPVVSTGSGADMSDVYVARLDGDLKGVWSETIQPEQGDALALQLGAFGDEIYIAGASDSSVVVAGETMIPFELPQTPAQLLLKLDGAGAVVWSRVGGGGVALGLGVDPNDGSLVSAGQARAVIDFGGGPLQVGGDTDIDIVRLHADGAHDWSALYGSKDNQSGQFEWGARVAVDVQGQAYALGQFIDEVDFGVGLHVTQPGARGLFIVKFAH